MSEKPVLFISANDTLEFVEIAQDMVDWYYSRSEGFQRRAAPAKWKDFKEAVERARIHFGG